MSPMNADPPHGSPAGFDAGCRTRAQCPNGDDSPYLSCTEAATRRRADYRTRKLAPDQPLPRATATIGTPTAQQPLELSEIHGTVWGYRRGCRERRACPCWPHGTMTCAEARHHYIRQYRAQRMSGNGAQVPHGTPNGYYLGCRDPRSCPGDAEGTTCTQARAQYRTRLARAAGIAPRTETIRSDEAARRIHELRDRGLSLRAIAVLTGCGRTTIAELAQPQEKRRTRITPETFQRIMETKPGR